MSVLGTKVQVVVVNGRAAYRYEGDQPKPSKAHCWYECLTTWPAVLTDGSKGKVSGIKSSLVGMMERSGGYRQVTLAGWPLYTFSKDKQVGDIKGEGFNGDWSLVTPDGTAAVKKAQKKRVFSRRS
ncbi:hypothetical protein [Streptomyces sp. NPDC056661]|uniref:COG4315 family predicted lipoprotein n=1 Tax=Streptomyces sp. NPDC056661 TaxID=3345898 RepID=UPI0036BFC067